jgi:hypothetical protein
MKVAAIDDNCIGEATDLGRQILSMSVDRNGLIWVLVRSTSLGRALLTIDASKGFECSRRGALSGPLKPLDIAFAAQPEGTGEALFAVLDRSPSNPPRTAPLGVVTTVGSTVESKEIGLIDDANATLTGTGDGRLFAYFSTSNAIVPIDPKTGKGLPGISLPAEEALTRFSLPFAFFGGAIYIFPNSNSFQKRYGDVWRVNLTTRSTEKVYLLPEGDIIGAGVSACAPVMIQ